MLEKIRNKMAETFKIDKDRILPETKLKEDLSLDSLDLYELVVAIEDEYDVKFPENELQDIVTVGDIMNMLERHNVG